MSAVEMYAVCCPRCETAVRVPGWLEAAAEAAPHASRCGRINIRRVWLRPAGGSLGAGAGVSG